MNLFGMIFHWVSGWINNPLGSEEAYQTGIALAGAAYLIFVVVGMRVAMFKIPRARRPAVIAVHTMMTFRDGIADWLRSSITGWTVDFQKQ